MSAILISLAVAAAACSWDDPGRDPYMGDVPAAVDRYTDLAPAMRERLKARMRARQYDEIVTITRDSVTGTHMYAPEITQMHFGSKGRVCASVTRARWDPTVEERALAYCEGDTCVFVPTVCRNVSRGTRILPTGAGLTAPVAAPAAALGVPDAMPTPVTTLAPVEAPEGSQGAPADPQVILVTAGLSYFPVPTPYFTAPAPAAPVPEPPGWLLALAAVPLVRWAQRRAAR